MTQQDKRDTTEKHPEGLAMGDQGPTYGSSYTENTPGETEANRQKSLREEREGDEQQPNVADRER